MEPALPPDLEPLAFLLDEGDVLRYETRMAAVGQSLAVHLRAELRRD